MEPSEPIYESGEQRRSGVVPRHRVLILPAILLSLIVVVGVVVLALVALAMPRRPSHTNLTVVNQTAFTLIDAGFTDHHDERCISVGPVPGGQFRQMSADFDAPDNTGDAIPIGFSFDQNGRTFRVPLSGSNIADRTDYTITVTSGQVTVVCASDGTIISTYVRTPLPK